MPNKRLIQATHVRDTGVEVKHLVSGTYVTADSFAQLIRSASLSGHLIHIVTQSTGFGWRTVWEVSRA